MDSMQNLTKIWRRPLVRRVAIGVVWAVALFGLAIPAWQDTVINQREIEELEQSLAAMDQWSVAGLWLERSVTRKEPVVNGAWNRLFPVDRGREALFLDLARVADRAGVLHFDLAEATGDGMMDTASWQDGSSMGAEPEDGPGEWVDESQTAGVTTIEIPEVEVESYRIRATFHSDYRGTARFLGGLDTIDRALSLHSLAVRHLGDVIQVDMELDVYVSRTTES